MMRTTTLDSRFLSARRTPIAQRCKDKRRPRAPSAKHITWLTILRPRPAVEHDDGPAILRPARDVVADSDRPFFPVGYCPHPRGLDAARGEIVPHSLRAPCAKREVVLAGSPLVGMALDQEAVLRVTRQPLRLPVEGGDRSRRQVGLVGLEEDPVADILGEVLAAPRGGRAGRRTRPWQASLLEEQAAAVRARARTAANRTARDVFMAILLHTSIERCADRYPRMVKGGFRQP